MALTVRPPVELSVTDVDVTVFDTLKDEEFDRDPIATSTASFTQQVTRAQGKFYAPVDALLTGCMLYFLSSNADEQLLRLQFPNLLHEEAARFERTTSSSLPYEEDEFLAYPGSGLSGLDVPELDATATGLRLNLVEASRLAVKILREAEADRVRAAEDEARIAFLWDEE